MLVDGTHAYLPYEDNQPSSYGPEEYPIAELHTQFQELRAGRRDQFARTVATLGILDTHTTLSSPISPYLDALGIEIKPHFFLHNIPRNRIMPSTLQESSIAEMFDNRDAHGFHDLSMEAIGIEAVGRTVTPAIRDRNAIHFMVRANGVHTQRLDYNEEYAAYQATSLSSGFIKASRGAWYEAAISEWLSAGYAELHNLSIDQGFLFDSGFLLPQKYAYTGAPDAAPSAGSALAATGLELLAAKNPKILDAALASRHQIHGGTEIFAEIDRASRGTSEFLYGLPLTHRGLVAGLERIIADLYQGDASRTSMIGQDVSAAFLLEKMVG